jgi:FkbM family methyltransferase
MNKMHELEKVFREGVLEKASYIEQQSARHQSLWEYRDFLAGCGLASIEITSTDVFFKTQEETVFVCAPCDTRSAPFELLNFKNYEVEEMKVLRSILDEDSIVFDVGANIGWYTVHLARHAKKGKVFSFEPIKKTFEFLQKNVALNSLNNVTLLNYGLSDQEREETFFYDPTLACAASLRNLHEEREQQKVTCSVKKLDDVSEQLRTRIDCIKCDVEGAEKLVIQGGIKTIKKHAPILFLELLRKWSAKFGYHPNDVIELLQERGYNAYGINAQGVRQITKVTDETPETNFIFVHREKHKKAEQWLVS